MEEQTLIFRRERIRFGEPDEDAMAILICEAPGQQSSFVDEETTVKTECKADELTPGLSYRFYGHWTTHAKYGRQFIAKTFVRCRPHGQQAVCRYLCEAPGIGPATAQKLWKKFEADSLRILREDPEVAATAVGGSFDVEKARNASAWLTTESAMESCTIDLMDLLDGKGFPKRTGKNAVQAWGNKAAEWIRRNPYRLMAFRGCGFKRCDDLYKVLGLPEGRLKRQALCAWYVLARDNDGHTWFQLADVVLKLREYIPPREARETRALVLAVRAGILAVKIVDGVQWYAIASKARNEQLIADRIAELSAGPMAWPAIDGLPVSEHQRTQLASALVAPVSTFTGAPGTGKTYTTARLIAKVIEEHGADHVCVCAPTGKAASRLGEALAGYDVPLRPQTIHSTLGVAKRSDGEGWGFIHNEANPLPQRWFFLDEGSMPDVDIAAAFCKALPVGAHLLIIGDTNQLPPIGHGAPLRDMLRGGVPTGELREIQRQAAGSRIVNTCHAIRDGRSWTVPLVLSPETGENLAVVPSGSGEASVEKIVTKLKAIRDAGLADPVWDCQVITAVNAKSPLARTAMNTLLQAEFNGGGQRGDGPFRIGDKIICLKNGLYPLGGEDDSGDVFVANGEIGRVLTVDGKLTIAKFTAPDRVVKVLGFANEGEEKKDDESEGSGKRFDLAYAVTCHKMQGSEAPIVFVCIDDYPGARRVCGREWLYTAISRAKAVCFLVGSLDTARSMCLRKVLDRRKTFLAEIIQTQRFKP